MAKSSFLSHIISDTRIKNIFPTCKGKVFLSIFNDLSSELMLHERSNLELMEGLEYNGFDSRHHGRDGIEN